MGQPYHSQTLGLSQTLLSRVTVFSGLAATVAPAIRYCFADTVVWLGIFWKQDATSSRHGIVQFHDLWHEIFLKSQKHAAFIVIFFMFIYLL